MAGIAQRLTALLAAYAVALQAMLVLTVAASAPVSAEAVLLCAADHDGAGDRAGHKHLCVLGCAMPGCGLALAEAPRSAFEYPAVVRAAPHSRATPAATPVILPHATARAPPSV